MKMGMKDVAACVLSFPLFSILIISTHQFIGLGVIEVALRERIATCNSKD